MRYNIKKCVDGWELWENATGNYFASAVSGTGSPERFMCHMTADEVLEIFNETVPRIIEEPYMVGNVNCKHAWRPWKFNPEFIQCVNCPAMRRVKRLVPKEYK
jgi:hypothetical protein